MNLERGKTSTNFFYREKHQDFTGKYWDSKDWGNPGNSR